MFLDLDHINNNGAEHRRELGDGPGHEVHEQMKTVRWASRILGCESLGVGSRISEDSEMLESGLILARAIKSEVRASSQRLVSGLERRLDSVTHAWDKVFGEIALALEIHKDFPLARSSLLCIAPENISMLFKIYEIAHRSLLRHHRGIVP